MKCLACRTSLALGRDNMNKQPRDLLIASFMRSVAGPAFSLSKRWERVQYLTVMGIRERRKEFGGILYEDRHGRRLIWRSRPITCKLLRVEKEQD